MQIIALCRRCYPVFAAALMLFTATVLVQKWPQIMTAPPRGREFEAIATILPYFPHTIFLCITIMGLCVQNAGLMLTGWSAGLISVIFIHGYSPPPGQLPEAMILGLALLPAFFSLMHRRRSSLVVRICWMAVAALWVWTLAGGYSKAIIAVPEISMVITMASAIFEPLAHQLQPLRSYIEGIGLTIQPATIVCLIIAAGLFFHFFRTKDALPAGYAGMVIAIWLGLTATGNLHGQAVFFSAGGLILIVMAIWSAFTLAYHDELTGLPGRRSLNEALASLGKTYVIAMIDVDHFKKFNDTYGHKTGDQVLKRLAAQMLLLSGGARVFRYGGEEFTAIFPGKSIEKAVLLLNKFRETLANTPFIVRGKARKKSSAKSRAKEKNKAGKAVQVTVSIGVACPGKNAKRPTNVIKAADKALYRAKKAGRNRVMR